MIENIILILVVIFFAVNMGASGIAPAFASIYGAKWIKKRKAILLFGLFVILGAIVLGRNVSVTLGKSLIPQEALNPRIVLVILGAASIGLFLANILKIPQSTSQVTVSSIVGAGLYLGGLNTKTLFFKILPAWLILPALSYLFTLLIYRKIYPPKHDNLHIYEKMFANEKRLKLSALVVSCYVAFAIGSNNVANAVGPLYGARIISILPGLFLISPIFGLGAWVLGKGPLNTAGKEIVPLGLFSSTLVSFTTATLLLMASFLGIPQSLVQLNLASIFAVSSVKNGHKHTWDHHIIQKTVWVWLITPIISLVGSFLVLHWLKL